MNILLIHAHPEPKSFCSAMKDIAVEALIQQGHSVELSDLYAMAFNPVASASDFASRKNPDYLVYALEQRHAGKTHTLAEDIAQEVEELRQADMLLLNFPLYWCSVPAILKGWLDRVFLSGYCYGGRRFYDQGGLRGKKAMLSFSLGSQQHMFGPDSIHGELDLMLRHLLQGTLAYTGMEVLPYFAAWHAPYISDAQRNACLDEFRQHLQKLEQFAPLPMPSLNHFDENLYPRFITRGNHASD